MNSNTRLMLEALRHSPNENTREHAIDVLEGRAIPFDSKGLGAEQLATTGILGDFLRAVMTGDFLAAYGAADLHNQRALRSILGISDELW